MDLYHLVIYVPAQEADRLRSVLAEHGGGSIGNYDSCSFSIKGTGRFRPLEGSKPAIGTPGSIEVVEEERIEAVVSADPETLAPLLRAVREAHPYEEPAIHLLPMIDYRDCL